MGWMGGTARAFCTLAIAVFPFLPIPPVQPVQPIPSARSEYVGADACASCHRAIHDTWTSGRHSKMIQRATAATVEGDFTAGTLTLRGRQYGVRARGGEFFITESELDRG